MNWEEAVSFARRQDKYRDLIKYSYLDEDLFLNIDRFGKSEEWKLTLELIGQFKSGVLNILDIGCGNGIAAISFAMLGHNVVAIDPDESDSVGLGAVRKLKQFYKLDNLRLMTGSAETLNETNEFFDIVYCRQYQLSKPHSND